MRIVTRNGTRERDVDGCNTDTGEARTREKNGPKERYASITRAVNSARLKLLRTHDPRVGFRIYTDIIYKCAYYCIRVTYMKNNE